ncbi:anhydro-N-acetylmuramic acid kinase [Pseudotabrizicola algicola]|uniref:Anhydro-N-acetylmuramic acid kinase n=1 Tax=Pseudotabrizicola algicola TaxID=2709381 RepID=A0A6B3RF99_9RHOB|nr:anhydro-N-acetylmuramic acid kinase [Pseudotabrizicola algicola]NEX44630.1 anhydro-N-acetylmuramic acid kinase [Pseudotabrizicola algicola]
MRASEAIWALGAMSGTSLDGVDAAMVMTDGYSLSGFGPDAYRPYSADERAVIRRAFGLWPGDEGVEAAAEVVEAAHAEVLSRFSGVDVVGFHGQTLAHDPRGRGTHQAGNGALLAEVLGVPVVWDFRSTDVRMGGQGAPLAPFFHHACARFAGLEHPVAFLNLGGVGNLTWVDPRVTRPEAAGALLAFDTGPANAPLNDLMLERRGAAHDEGGALALAGTVDEGVVSGFLAHAYFHKMPPKSLDRNDFPALLPAVANLGDADAAATLVACAAAAVARGAEHFPQPVGRVLVCGGGRHNGAMMAALSARMGAPVEPVEAIGLNGDMLEAQAFAYLAVRVMRGLPTSAPATTGVAAAVGGGQISRP